MTISHYEILDVQDTDDSKTIKDAYKRLIAIWHSDKTSIWAPAKQLDFCVSIFLKIQNAYQTLSDNVKRKQYDMQLSISKKIPPSQKDILEKDQWKALKKIHEEFEKSQNDPKYQIAVLQKQLQEEREINERHKKNADDHARELAELKVVNGGLEKRNKELEAECAELKNRLAKLQRSTQASQSSSPVTQPQSSVHTVTMPQDIAIDAMFGQSHHRKVFTFGTDSQHQSWRITLPLNIDKARSIVNALHEIQKFINNKIDKDYPTSMGSIRFGLYHAFGYTNLNSGYNAIIASDLENSLKANKPAEVNIELSVRDYELYIAPHLSKTLTAGQTLFDFLAKHFSPEAKQNVPHSGSTPPFFKPAAANTQTMPTPEQMAIDMIFTRPKLMKEFPYLQDVKCKSWTVELPLDIKIAAKTITNLLEIQLFINEKISNEQTTGRNHKLSSTSHLKNGYCHLDQTEAILTHFRKCKETNTSALVEFSIKDNFYAQYILPNLDKKLSPEQTLSNFLEKIFSPDFTGVRFNWG